MDSSINNASLFKKIVKKFDYIVFCAHILKPRYAYKDFKSPHEISKKKTKFLFVFHVQYTLPCLKLYF